MKALITKTNPLGPDYKKAPIEGALPQTVKYREYRCKFWYLEIKGISDLKDIQDKTGHPLVVKFVSEYASAIGADLEVEIYNGYRE